MPFCPKCGSEIRETDKFCRKCGYKLIEQGKEEITKKLSEKPIGLPSVIKSRGLVVALLLLILIGAGGYWGYTQYFVQTPKIRCQRG